MVDPPIVPKNVAQPGEPGGGAPPGRNPALIDALVPGGLRGVAVFPPYLFPRTVPAQCVIFLEPDPPKKKPVYGNYILGFRMIKKYILDTRRTRVPITIFLRTKLKTRHVTLEHLLPPIFTKIFNEKFLTCLVFKCSKKFFLQVMIIMAHQGPISLENKENSHYPLYKTLRITLKVCTELSIEDVDKENYSRKESKEITKSKNTEHI